MLFGQRRLCNSQPDTWNAIFRYGSLLLYWFPCQWLRCNLFVVCCDFCLGQQVFLKNREKSWKIIFSLSFTFCTSPSLQLRCILFGDLHGGSRLNWLDFPKRKYIYLSPPNENSQCRRCGYCSSWCKIGNERLFVCLTWRCFDFNRWSPLFTMRSIIDMSTSKPRFPSVFLLTTPPFARHIPEPPLSILPSNQLFTLPSVPASHSHLYTSAAIPSWRHSISAKRKYYSHKLSRLRHPHL